MGLPCLTKAIQAAQERILAGHPNMADMTVKRLVNPRVDLHRLSYPGALALPLGLERRLLHCVLGACVGLMRSVWCTRGCFG